jgi:phage repressor protein C with HTH and peptisase S24 domain
MLSHEQIWAAIDALAARHNLSPSGLARRAGLDATAFNKSKRHAADGRPRWPSTESIAKVIAATGESVENFFAAANSAREGRGHGWRAVSSSVPLLGFAQAGGGGYFDDAGFPVSHGWDVVELPVALPAGAYALQVQGDSMLPLYRDRDILIVDPETPVRHGDRVVVRTTAGEVMAKVLERRTRDRVELASLNPEHASRVLRLTEVAWMARILWASQ